MANWFYIGFLTVLLLILGEKYPKVALAIAGLVFFGAVLFNIDTFKKLLTPTSVSTTHTSSSGVQHGGAGGSF